MREVLETEGYRVTCAHNGAEAFRAFQRELPDLIVSDVMMPQMDGFEVLAATHADPALRGIPFVFLSASAEPEKLEAALQQGATGYVTKPFNLAHLRQLLTAQLVPASATPPSL